MGAANAINTAQETVESLTPNAEAMKAAALNTCHSAVDLCTGHTIKGEIGRLADSCLSAPIEMAASSLEACKNLCTGHPIEAVKTAANGFGQACYRVTEQITAAPRLAGATVKTGAKTAVEAVKLPVTLPMAVYRKGNVWFERATDFAFGSDMPIAANDNASSSSSTPSTPPQGSGFNTAA